MFENLLQNKRLISVVLYTPIVNKIISAFYNLNHNILKTQWILCKKNEMEQCWLLSLYLTCCIRHTKTHLFRACDLIYFSCNKYIVASSFTFKEANSFSAFLFCCSKKNSFILLKLIISKLQG